MSDYTHISIVLDRSGSMSSIREEMQGGLDTFLAEQAKEPGRATVSAYLFDDQYEKTIDFMDITDHPSIILKPRNMTALHDAVCRAIDDTGRQLAEMDENDRPDTVIFLVITDGHENSSVEFSGEDVKKRIEHQRDTYNWDFVFLGANQDAVATGQSLGFRGDSSLTFAATSKGVTNSANILGNYVRNTRYAGGNTQTYTDEDREAAQQS